MYVFLGPKPNDVIEQYSTAIGRTFLPPYWSLGFQLCRWGYGSLDTVKDTVQRMDDYGIPLVSFCLKMCTWRCEDWSFLNDKNIFFTSCSGLFAGYRSCLVC